MKFGMKVIPLKASQTSYIFVTYNQ